MELNELDIAFFKQLKESNTLKIEIQLRDKIKVLEDALREIIELEETEQVRSFGFGDIARKALK